MDKSQLKQVLECLLFVANRPISMAELVDIVGENQSEIEQTLAQLQDDLTARQSPLQISRVAEGVQFSTQEQFHYWIKKLFKDQTTFKLSPSAMETLAIIAYKQPVTRAEVDQIRGVDSGGVIEKLFERRLIKIVGRKEALGRPMLYGTTLEFLRHFNLWKISDLPSLEELSLQLETMLENTDQTEIEVDPAEQVELPQEQETSPATDVFPQEPAQESGQEQQTQSSEVAPSTAELPEVQDQAAPDENKDQVSQS